MSRATASWRGGLYLESCLLAGEASPQAMRRLIQLMNAKDERVSYMATTAVLDRSGVKPIDYDPSHDQQPAALDIAVLSDEEREQLKALAAEGDRQNVNRRGGLRLAAARARRYGTAGMGVRPLYHPLI